MRRPWHAGAAELNEEARLANRISDRISPRLVTELETLPWWQTQVLALRVYPSPSRPDHLPISWQGRSILRVSVIMDSIVHGILL
jgi:hypothetical protein